MRGWYGPPIALAGVPGRVYAAPGGDFVGRINGGSFAGFLDFAEERVRRLHRALLRVARGRKLYMGFSSFADLISEATHGKRLYFPFEKDGAPGTPSVGATASLWRRGNQPAAAANASNAPGGDAPTSATTGAFGYTNPTNPDTLHLTRADIAKSSTPTQTLLLYDRIFQVNKTMSSTVTEAVTGVPTRYQSTTGGADDSAEGNFLFVETGATLSATAHNWTVCRYTDQGGATLVNLPSLTGFASALTGYLDHLVNQWFAPLASGDTGILALTQMQCSAAMTGTINFVIGHPIAFFPCPIANQGFIYDGINSAFNLTRIFDDAALAFLEVNKGNVPAASTYRGLFEAVAG